MHIYLGVPSSGDVRCLSDLLEPTQYPVPGTVLLVPALALPLLAEWTMPQATERRHHMLAAPITPSKAPAHHAERLPSTFTEITVTRYDKKYSSVLL